jgi:hypothetical protein
MIREEGVTDRVNSELPLEPGPEPETRRLGDMVQPVVAMIVKAKTVKAKTVRAKTDEAEIIAEHLKRTRKVVPLYPAASRRRWLVRGLNSVTPELAVPVFAVPAFAVLNSQDRPPPGMRILTLIAFHRQVFAGSARKGQYWNSTAGGR